MKSSICIILNKLNLFNKNRKNKLYDYFENMSLETLNDIDFTNKFILVFDEDENFCIQNMIIKTIKQTNKKIIYNKKVYNNPTRFILKNASILSFMIDADIFMLSVNRESLKYIDMKKVDYFLINDINRNYSYKNIDEEDAIKKIVKSLSNKTKLVLNLDNPNTNTIKYFHHGKTIGYGIKDDVNNNAKDIRCPICHENILYKSRYFLSFGNYICPNGDFDTGIKSYEAEVNFSKKTLKINNNKFKLNTNYYYDIYYLLGFYAISDKLGIKTNFINDYKNDLEIKQINNITFNLFNPQNGNIINYQKYINYASNQKKPIVLGFSNIFDNSSLDLSWLYEIDFKPLKNNKIYICGLHQKDIEVRLLYDNLNPTIIDNINDIKENNIFVLMPTNEFNQILGDNL